jgi:Bacterial mobilisation protein (MobC)
MKPASPPHPRRSGSEKRQRGKPVSVRLLTSERALLEFNASAAGLAIGPYLRAKALGSPGPRAKRSAPINAELLAYATAALNKVGSNVNQIAHALNAMKHPAAQDAADTLREVRAAVAQIRGAFGRDDLA